MNAAETIAALRAQGCTEIEVKPDGTIVGRAPAQPAAVYPIHLVPWPWTYQPLMPPPEPYFTWTTNVIPAGAIQGESFLTYGDPS